MHRAWIAGLIASVSLACTGSTAQVKIPEPQATVRWHDVSIGDYGQHLIALKSLVEECAKARDVKSCDPALVGPDDRISIAVGGKTERRLIRYGWLRILFVKAEEPDEKAAKPSASKGDHKQDQVTIGETLSTSQLLKDASKRLKSDLAQSERPPAAIPNYAQEHAVMQEVLAGKDFQHLQADTVSDSILEKLGNWLNRLFAGVANLKARSAWIGRAIVWGFILAVCTLLGYSLLRLERRWRLRLTPEDDQRLGPSAASARDWQLWLEDARRSAASGRWREAIHFVYWAAISRLESRRLWPADRARTPREYLALVAQEDPRKAGLSQLTAEFERFWYGGRAAGESDYWAAESLATTLIGGRALDEGDLASEDGGR